MTKRWRSNTPARFWLCQPEPPAECWQVAVQKAVPVLGLAPQPDDVDRLLALVLGEGRSGFQHWDLSSARRLYYTLKPRSVRTLPRFLRWVRGPSARSSLPLAWPIEDRCTRFKWEIVRQRFIATGQQSVWPQAMVARRTTVCVRAHPQTAC